MGVMPNYNVTSKFGDIALLLLDNPSAATPVDLADNTTSLNGTSSLVALGWGQLQNGSFPDTLQSVQLPTMTPQQCAVAHAPLGVMPPDHFCVGLDPHHKSTCPGDSGGPMLVETNGTAPVQVALVSYGPAGYTCGGKDNLDVVTSIAYWRSWIEDTLSIYNMRG